MSGNLSLVIDSLLNPRSFVGSGLIQAASVFPMATPEQIRQYRMRYRGGAQQRLAEATPRGPVFVTCLCLTRNRSECLPKAIVSQNGKYFRKEIGSVAAMSAVAKWPRLSEASLWRVHKEYE